MDQVCIRFLRGLPEFAAVCVTSIAISKGAFAERVLVSSVQAPAAVFIFFAGSFRLVLAKDHLAAKFGCTAESWNGTTDTEGVLFVNVIGPSILINAGKGCYAKIVVSASGDAISVVFIVFSLDNVFALSVRGFKNHTSSKGTVRAFNT